MDIVENVGQLEQVENKMRIFPFPVITIYPRSKKIYFNKAAEKYLDFDKFEFFFNSEYVVMLPAKSDSAKFYRKHKHYQNKRIFVQCPVDLVEKKISGSFKLKRYKNGFCFNRNEKL